MAEKKRTTCEASRISKREYEAPRAMRMGALTAGKGDCTPSGSGDTTICDQPGNAAPGFGRCGSPGNSADACDATGNSPTTRANCGGPGNIVGIKVCFGPGSDFDNLI
jgi:hypothetical protein